MYQIKFHHCKYIDYIECDCCGLIINLSIGKEEVIKIYKEKHPLLDLQPDDRAIFSP